MAERVPQDRKVPCSNPALDPKRLCFKKALSLVIDNHGIVGIDRSAKINVHWMFFINLVCLLCVVKQTDC